MPNENSDRAYIQINDNITATNINEDKVIRVLNEMLLYVDDIEEIALHI